MTRRERWCPTIAHAGEALNDMPGAVEVRDVLGYVTIDGFRISHSNNWGDERFPWVVHGPIGSGDADVPDSRKHLDEFATYREAVRLARRAARAAFRAVGTR